MQHKPKAVGLDVGVRGEEGKPQAWMACESVQGYGVHGIQNACGSKMYA